MSGDLTPAQKVAATALAVQLNHVVAGQPVGVALQAVSALLKAIVSCGANSQEQADKLAQLAGKDLRTSVSMHWRFYREQLEETLGPTKRGRMQP